MEQDGEPDQPATPAPPADLSTGKVLLTMYTPSDHAAGYRHMLIPFPSSFVACGEAVQCFREHLPANEVSMSLHQAVQRKDGEYVWSVITKDTWDTVLDKDCQEIGVFIHTGSHDSARFEYKKPPDANPPKRLVSFQFRDGYDIGPNILRVVRSFEDCETYAAEAIKTRKWAGFELTYDQRMVGSEAERKTYREQGLRYSGTVHGWHALDADLFDFLINVHPEPMKIQIIPLTA